MSAPYYADIAKGPDGAVAHWVETSDGMRLRIVVWPGAGRGTVVIFTGRAEYAEKYGPTARDLIARGFSAIAVEWRGQGLSTRPDGRTDLGHVGHFSEYQRDVAAVMAHPALVECQKPLHLLAHSMGGAIGFRALLEGLEVEGAFFSAPMWGIKLPSLARAIARPLAGGLSAVGFSETRVPFTGTESYVLDHPYEGNCLTTDAETYAWMRGNLTTHADLGLGGPTFGWISSALAECRALAKAKPPRKAVSVLGTAEGVVDPAAIHDRMGRPGSGQLHLVEGARHEILMEQPSLRDQFWEVFDAAMT